MIILSRKELQAKLKVSRNTLYWHTKNSDLKSYKVRMGSFVHSTGIKTLPAEMDNKTKLVFIWEEVEEFFSR